jgi:DNA-binding beta-propeller fold protein YncE
VGRCWLLRTECPAAIHRHGRQVGRNGSALTRSAALLRAAILAVATTAASAQQGAPLDQPTADLLVLDKIRSQADLPGDLAFVNFASGAIVARVPVGREPHEVAASGDRRYALVTNTGNYTDPGNTLSLIDVQARRELRRVDLGPLGNPHGVLPMGSRFLFTAEGARVIGAYDPERDHVDWIMGTGQDTTHLLAQAAQGKTIYATNRGSSTVSTFKQSTDAGPAGSWLLHTNPVCGAPEGIDVAPDGGQVWIGCRGSNEIGILDAATGSLLRRFTTHTQSLARLKFTLDGRSVLVTDPKVGELVVFDVRTHAERARLQVGLGCEGLLLVPDGRHALVAVTNEDNVAVVDLETLRIERRIQTGTGPDGMAWIGR